MVAREFNVVVAQTRGATVTVTLRIEAANDAILAAVKNETTDMLYALRSWASLLEIFSNENPKPDGAKT